MSETSSENKVYIELGDIIDITAPEDTSLDGKRFLVDYIDRQSNNNSWWLTTTLLYILTAMATLVTKL